MAIQLACGSKNPELRDLIQEGKETSSVVLWICSGRGQVQSKVILRRRISGITIDYYYNNQNITINGLRKKMQQFNIYIDNPFMSMTQFDSQKILKMSGDKKLEFVQQLSNTNIKKLSYDNMQKEFQELDHCLKYYNGQRNEFQQAMAEFVKQNILAELKVLKRELRKTYVCLCYQETQEQLIVKQKDFNDVLKDYNQVVEQISQQKQQLQTTEEQIDIMKQKEQQQFAQMNQQTIQLEKFGVQAHQQQYQLVQAQNEYSKLIQMKEQCDNINLVEIQQKRKDQQQIYDQIRQKLQQLDIDQQKLTEEISTGMNVKQIEDQQKLISQTKMSIINAQATKINQSLYGNQQLRAFYNDQFFQQNRDNCNIEQLTKFVIAGGDTMIKLSKDSMIPNQTRQQILMFTCSNILRTIYSNDKEYTKKLEEINIASVKNCTISFMTKFQNVTYNQFIQHFANNLKQLKQQRNVNKYGLSEYNILPFSDAFDGNPFMLYQISMRLQNYYYLDKIMLKDNKIITQKQADSVCSTFLRQNKNIIGIVFQDTLYRQLKHNNEIVGTERIKLQLVNFKCLQPQDQIYDILFMKQNLYKQQQQLIELQTQQDNQKQIKLNSQKQLEQCRQQIKYFTNQRNEIQDLIEQYTNQINNVKIISPIQIQLASNKIQVEKNKLSIIIQRMVDINDKIITQYEKDKDTLNQITKLRAQAQNIHEFIKELNQKQDALQEVKQQRETELKQINYQLQQQIIDLKEFSENNQDLNQFSKKILKESDKLNQKISKVLHVDKPQITIKQLQEYINISTNMLKKNAQHQIHDLPQLQAEICKNLNKILVIYAKISFFANKFIQNVQILNNQLEIFVQQLSEQFRKNLSLFNVSGELQLKIWSENLYQKKFQDFKSYFTKQNIQQNLGAFYKIYSKYCEIFSQQNIDNDEDEEEDNQTEIKPIDQIIEEFDQQTPDEFQQSFNSFTPIIQFTDFENIINNLRPSVQIISRFSSGVKQQNIILSGGEQSVTTLCIAACCKKVAFILSDEINQNLDSKFEVAAHNLVCSLDGQAIISSPKIDVGEDFDDPKINIIILSKNYHQK